MTESEELRILREAVVDLTNPSLINNVRAEITHQLARQGIAVHWKYNRVTCESQHRYSVTNLKGEEVERYTVLPSGRRVSGRDMTDDEWDEITHGRTGSTFDVPSVNPTSSDGFYPRVTPRPASNKKEPK